MKWLIILLLVILSYLQYRLWLSEGSATDLLRLHSQIDEQATENLKLASRNQLLSAEVEALKNTDDAIEERARNDLGMIKKGETYFMVVEPATKK